MNLPKCWNEPAFPSRYEGRRDGLTIGQYATIEAMQGMLSCPVGPDHVNTPHSAVNLAILTLRELERLEDGEA